MWSGEAVVAGKWRGVAEACGPADLAEGGSGGSVAGSPVEGAEGSCDGYGGSEGKGNGGVSAGWSGVSVERVCWAADDGFDALGVCLGATPGLDGAPLGSFGSGEMSSLG